MSRWDIPATWEWIPISDVAEVVGGGTPPASDESNFEVNGMPWITPADLSGFDEEYVSRGRRSLSVKGLESSGVRLLPPGTVLFTSRAPIGYCVIAANDIATNQGFKNFILFGGISPRYLRFYLLASREYAESLASGTTFRELSQARASKILVPIAPLEEQVRIVSRLDALRKRVKSIRGALNDVGPLVEEFRRAALAKAFSGELTADWRPLNANVETGGALLERLKVQNIGGVAGVGAEDSDDTSGAAVAGEAVPNGAGAMPEVLPALPPTWKWGLASEVVEPGTDISYGIVQPGEHVQDGVPYVRAKDVQDGVILIGQLLRTQRAIADAHARSSLRGGDVLLGIIRATKVAVVPDELEGGNITQGTARFRPSSIILTNYLARWLASPFAQRWLQRRYRGIDMPGLNLRDVRLLPVPIAPLEEQQVIVLRLSEAAAPVSAVAIAARDAYARSLSLEQAFVDKAFRGALTRQQPTDDPASAIIARARAERIKAAADRQRVRQPRAVNTRSAVQNDALAEAMRKWIEQTSGRPFTFDELRKALPHKYEDIKVTLFAMLDDGSSLIKQFNPASKRIELRGIVR